MALRWVALGYTDVQVRMGVHARVPFRPFPASRDEAVRAVGELAAQRQPFASQWRRFAARVDRELAAERAAAKELVKSS